jgi:hypothetical protein
MNRSFLFRLVGWILGLAAGVTAVRAQGTLPVPVTPSAILAVPDPLPKDLTSRFIASYRRAGNPRVAILYNRELGDQLAAWTMDAKTVVTEAHSPGWRVFTVDRQYAGAPQAESGYCRWAFENGLSAPFFAAGVKLVDATVSMEMAARTSADPSTGHIADINTNLQALKATADWVVQVTFQGYPAAGQTCQIRAVATRLADGRMLAAQILRSSDVIHPMGPPRVVAASGGYRFESETPPPVTVDECARLMAAKLMEELVQTLDGA